jgi:repressor LexA
MDSLTSRQTEILQMIRAFLAERGYPPTRHEIAQALGFRSVNAAVDHLKALARKGAIELLPSWPRSISRPVTGWTRHFSSPGPITCCACAA